MTVSWPAGLVLREVSWTGPEATGLRAQMDTEIVPRYAGLRFEAAPALAVDPALVHVTLVLCDGDTPVATTALKNTDGFFEVKRVFVAPSHRRLGLAALLLAEIEERARALGAAELVLQTGFRQPEAISLYERNGWTAIPNFGPYVVDTVISRCFAKPLTPLLVGVQLPGVGVDLSVASAHAVAIAALDAAGADLVIVDDTFGPGADPTAPVRLDAATVAAFSALRTTRTALIPVITTTHTEPFHVAKVVSSLDLATRGRAGWQLAVSTDPDSAGLLGRREALSAADAWAEAEEAIEVAERLWDSWEDDAEIRDLSTGRFVDRDKIHHIDFVGTFFAVRGPSIVPRTPQGRPPIVIALDKADAGFRFALDVAARRADVIRIGSGAGGADVDEVHTAVAEAGRGGQVTVLADLVVDGLSASELVALLLTWRHDTRSAGVVLVVDDFWQLDAVTDALGAWGGLTSSVPGAAVGPATFRDRLGLPRPESRYRTASVTTTPRADPS